MLSLRSHYYAGSPPTREMSSSSKLPVFSSNNHISDHTGNCLTSFHHVKLEERSNVLHQILESNGCWKVQAKIGAGLGSAPRGLESTPTIPTSVTFQNLMKYVSSISNRCTELDLHSMYDFPQSTSNTSWNRQPRHKTTAHARAQITCVESHQPSRPSLCQIRHSDPGNPATLASEVNYCNPRASTSIHRARLQCSKYDRTSEELIDCLQDHCGSLSDSPAQPLSWPMD
jgi:hypothetical protein